MDRNALTDLRAWKRRESRKPLVLRGARQVGKTWLVQTFGHEDFRAVHTFDLELDHSLHSLFDSAEPRGVVRDLSLARGRQIVVGEDLLFLDEIQACPRAIAFLRYFHEVIPDLHVIAAGSLLDFALREFAHSMPVGRVEFLHVHPLSFEEFLVAHGEILLAQFLQQLEWPADVSEPVHKKLLEWVRLYSFVGGMPEVVLAHTRNRDLVETQRQQEAILVALRADFAKYGTREQLTLMHRVLDFAARNVGNKVKYVQVSADHRAATIRTAVDLLVMSRIVHAVHHTAANGVPLGAESSEKSFKLLLVDVGLLGRIAGLRLADVEDLVPAYEGRLAEQVVGQQLLALGPAFEDRRLFTWRREARNANAEVDYLWTIGETILPVEVKAGPTGRLRSLHQFLAEKRRAVGVRFDASRPTRGEFDVSVRAGNASAPLRYRLVSLPFYLAGQLDRLLVTEV